MYPLIHKHTQKGTYTHQKDNVPHIILRLNTHTLTHTQPQIITCILPLLSFDWVKSSKNPSLVFDLPPTSAVKERVQEGGAGEHRAAHFSDKSNYGFMT